MWYDVPAALRSSFVADPVQWAADQPPPLAVRTETVPQGWLPVSDGTFYWDQTTRTRGTPRRYLQVHRAGPDPDVSPPFRFTDVYFDRALTPLRQNPVPRVKEYADQVLKNMVAAGALPAKGEWRNERTLLPEPEYHDLIARAFSVYLATTPTLEYTTDLRRDNTRVDPIEDFLFYSKVGHCERYATALVLMLRSQGIPAAFILGFKGCEQESEGRYLVKQEHAHAWVEALVPVPGPVPLDPSARVYHWRVLDPTPGGDQPTNVDTNWLAQANTWVEARFQEYLTNYTPEQRAKALAVLGAELAQPRTLVWAAGIGGLVFGIRFTRRRLRALANRPPEPPAPTRWFGELVALLAAHSIVPAPGATALEFATAASETLRLRPGCAEVADVPLAWASAYYQDRFGGAPPSDARLAELEAGLAALRRALA
jgi:transglutaminase-like putative cysteine protease